MKQPVPLGEEIRKKPFSSAQASCKEASIRSSRPTYQVSFSRLYNQSYFQSNLGSRGEPNPPGNLYSARGLYDDSVNTTSSTTSHDYTEHANKTTNLSLSRGNKYDTLLFEDDEQNSLCDFQDEDIASLCSSDWKF